MLGQSVEAINNLVRDGVIIRSTRGQYDLQKSVSNYIVHLRKVASSQGGEQLLETLQKIRATKAQADALELKANLASGEMIAAADVEREWSNILRVVRANMLAIPSRCSAHLSPQDVAQIDAEIRPPRLTRAFDKKWLFAYPLVSY